MKIKRLLCTSFSLLTAVSMLGMSTSNELQTICEVAAFAAEETPARNYTYSIQNGEVIITGCDKNATEIVIPDTIDGLPVTQLAEYSFCCCDELRSITFPKHLTAIPDGCFQGCQSLTTVILPEKLTVIGQIAFMNCENLMEINLPSSLKEIRNCAFTGCLSLPKITLPQGIEVMDRAFGGCTSLTTLSIPASVTDMTDSFSGCSSLETIMVDPDNAAYCSIDGVLYSKDGSELILYPKGSPRTTYIAPDTLKVIPGEAFYGVKTLTSVILPAHMTEIGAEAFGECDGLKQLTIPDGVTTLDLSVIHYCRNLEKITLPKSLVKISQFAEISQKDIYCPRLNEICYEGSVQDWSKIKIEDENPPQYQVVIRFGAEDTAVHQKVVLYVSASGLPIPEEHDTYQIENLENVNFRIIAGNTAEVSETGLVKPTKKYGETILELAEEEQVSFLHISVEDYAPVYADARITAFLEETITDDMTDLEKLEVIGKLPASLDYNLDHWDYVEMLEYNNGNCGGSATMLVEMCRRLGIKAWVRNANRDPNAGSAHINALAEVDGVYYELEAGYSGTAPRPYNMTKRTSLYKYKDAAEGIDVYQYDGINNSETALSISDTIDGKTVTRIGDSFLKENPWVRSVTIPDTVTEISESAFPDFKGILYGSERSAAADFAAAHSITFRVTGSLTAGDVNGDQEIDILDVIAVNQYLLGVSVLNASQVTAADVDADGEITSTDSLMVLKYVVKLIDSFH